MRMLSRRTLLRALRDSYGRLLNLVSIVTSCLHQARLDLTVKHGVFNVALVCVCRKCEGGSWQVLDDSACPIRCITSGVSHVITFDNKDYDYSGSCMYVLARDVDLAAFEILIENMLCGATGAICQKKITLRVRDANEEWNEYLLESVWHQKLCDAPHNFYMSVFLSPAAQLDSYQQRFSGHQCEQLLPRLETLLRRRRTLHNTRLHRSRPHCHVG